MSKASKQPDEATEKPDIKFGNRTKVQFFDSFHNSKAQKLLPDLLDRSQKKQMRTYQKSTAIQNISQIDQNSNGSVFSQIHKNHRTSNKKDRYVPVLSTNPSMAKSEPPVNSGTFGSRKDADGKEVLNEHAKAQMNPLKSPIQFK